MSADSIAAIQKKIREDQLILAVRLASGGDAAIAACEAAVAGGLTILEITLTTPGALDLIERFATRKDILVGAGTVLEAGQVARVADAGGRFALSPVFDPWLLEEAEKLGLLAIPGAATPLEILTAHRGGARLVKVFPCGPLGGPEYLRKIRGPLPQIPMVPTSGPTAATLDDYLQAGAVALGVGQEVFAPGFTPESIHEAARRLRKALEDAR